MSLDYFSFELPLDDHNVKLNCQIDHLLRKFRHLPLIHFAFNLACTGTESGLSTSGSSQQTMKRFKNRYTNCTVVEGNVELTNIENNVTFTKVFEV